MRSAVLLLAVCVAVAAATNSSRPARYSPIPSRQIRGAVIFRDDFKGSYLDRNNWDIEVSMYGGMNWEFQVYTNDPKNVFIQNEMLVLKPTFTVDDSRFSAANYLHTGKMDMTSLFGVCTQSANYGCTREGQYGMLPPVMSGKVKSRPTMKFGVVEIRAKIPKGDWIWPAMWMLPRSNHYGGWPRSGEIDIMESRGGVGDYGVGSVFSTLHWGPDFNNNRFSKTTGGKHQTDWSTDFHVWRLEWSPDSITTFVDNQQLMTVNPGSSFWNYGGFGSMNNIWASGGKMAPFDQDFYAIFNVAVGGTNGFFTDNAGTYTPARKPWVNSSPHAAQDFWDKRSDWQGTWDKSGTDSALVVDYIEFRNF